MKFCSLGTLEGLAAEVGPAGNYLSSSTMLRMFAESWLVRCVCSTVTSQVCGLSSVYGCLHSLISSFCTQ